MRLVAAISLILAVFQHGYAVSLETLWQIPGAPKGRITYSPDGLTIATSPSPVLWDPTTLIGRLRLVPATAGTYYDLDFVDGSTNCILLKASNITKYQVSDGHSLWSKPTNAATIMRVCPNDQLLVAGGNGLRLYSTVTGTFIRNILDNAQKVTQLEWTPNGQYLIIVVSTTVKILRKSDWVEVSTYQVPTLRCIVPSPSNQTAAISYDSFNGTTAIIDLFTGTILRSTIENPRQMQFTPDGSKLIAAVNGFLYCLDAQSLSSLWSTTIHSSCVGLAMNPAGTIVTGAYRDTTFFSYMRNFDVNTGAALSSSNLHAGAVTNIEGDTNGRFLASNDEYGNVCIRDAVSGATLWAFYESGTESIDFSPTDPIIAIYGRGTLRICDARNGSVLKIKNDAGGFFGSCAFSPNGQFIAVSGSTVILYRVSDLSIVAASAFFDPSAFKLQFSPDGSGLAIGSRRIGVLNSPSMTTRWTRELEYEIETLDFSPDGSKLTYGYNSIVTTVDTITGSVLWDRSNLVNVRALRYTPDSKYVVATGDSVSIVYLDGNTGANVTQFDGYNYNKSESLAVQKDGEALFIGEGNDVESAKNPFSPKFSNATGYTKLRGVLQGGGLQDLVVCDEVGIVVQNGLVLNGAEAPVWLEFTGNAPLQNPSWLRFSCIASNSTKGVSAFVELWDYAANAGTGGWSNAESVSAPLTPYIRRIDVTLTNPGRFVSETGQVRARVRCKVTGLISAGAWRTTFDKVLWSAQP